jgi:hypothetical protein
MPVERKKIAYLLERLSQAIAIHDRENPSHHAWGIGMSHFDIQRLGLEEGEQILPGIVLQNDGGVTGAFRVLCDGDHGSQSEEEEELVEARASEQQERELEPAQPAPAPRIRPPF